jgi:hypothetical protein
MVEKSSSSFSLSLRTALSSASTSSSGGVRTITTAQPSPAQTNLSEMSVHPQQPSSDTSSYKDENGNRIIDPVTEESNTNVSMPRTPISANVRFFVALAILVSQGFALLFCQTLLASSSVILHYLAIGFTIFISFFASEWIRIHSFALTRQKRAFFDEKNILETYQPRARTHGHLFHPDPPTPGAPAPSSVKFTDGAVPEHSTKEKAAFAAMRDAHYENMYEHAARLAKESEEADREALDAQRARLEREHGAGGGGRASEDSTTAIPKGEPLYEDVDANAPMDGPPIDNGTKLELPKNLMSEDSSSRGKKKSPKSPKSPKTKDLASGRGGNTSTAATSTSSIASASTQVDSKSDVGASSPLGKSQKKRKNKV